MSEKRIIIESLAMDLKRVAIGLQTGSIKMADRFKEEALKRAAELDGQSVSPYLNKLLANSKKVLLSNNERVGEDALMYSTLFQNWVRAEYNKKLVRDNIPQIIKAKGGQVKMHVATKAEYWQKLKEKLREEVEEFITSESPEELADILEVIDAIYTFKKIDKRRERGGFAKRIILEES